MAEQLIDLSCLEQVERDGIDDHVFDLYTSRAPEDNQNLGYINRDQEILEVQLKSDPGRTLLIQQSFSNLSSGVQSSSTGFLCWSSSLLLAEWIIGEKKCPIYKLFREKSDLTVLELGSGIGGILASLLGPKVKTYVASDQKHILRLLKENFEANAYPGSYVTEGSGIDTKKIRQNTRAKRTSSKNSLRNPSRIEFIEFDWEEPERGASNYDELQVDRPDLIIATDTIYNEYLIPHFTESVQKMLGDSSGLVLAVQLRDELVLESLLIQLQRSSLRIFNFPEHLLSNDLSKGYSVYYICK
ncbi:Piso0_003830 [Millerozyma farinosa CBS 7064]|uniref:Ribosomal lysine N-methyltransferase 5 n=1 Tax=Pichia sorbitophila (strain ATCC MYA-4447 / BCRC 22081 / CBS 7064 / NBRC 10061 / NRRL Y-12695) TaxID=559304 RepID=G8Y9M5_PICSO|nr:Piso0_003830 [Millerozyma farinosa CBS 7064]CCE84289.1 Piso0_003830 [Millerozyma farinosa CBS 7064]